MTQEHTPWVVYIIQTVGGKLYTGITTDPERRFKEHQSGVRGARFLRADKPLGIVYQESQPDRSQATRREMAIKKMSRSAKLKLVAAGAARLRQHENANPSSAVDNGDLTAAIGDPCQVHPHANPLGDG